MNQPAKAQEPSMEEILASIRRIIADDDAGKPAKNPEPAFAAPLAAVPGSLALKEPPPSHVSAMSQDDIDTMLAGLDAPAPPVAPRPAPFIAPEPEPEPDADVLDLTEAMMAAPPPQAAAPAVFTTIGEPDVVFAERPEPVPPPPPIRAATESPRNNEPPRNSMMMTDAPLLGSDTRAAVDASFGSLAHTVLAQNARTLDDLVKEMLRPMLKSWLDDNLPGLVERLVRAEIERVSRGRAI